jgi:hypothetical protein
MINSPNLFTSISAFVKINPSGITANLVQFGTSFVTSGQERDLILDPGVYSINPDESTFNASVSIDIFLILNYSNLVTCQDWTYEYQCRLYDSTNTGKWSPIHMYNNSCFSYRTGIQILSINLYYDLLFR